MEREKIQIKTRAIFTHSPRDERISLTQKAILRLLWKQILVSFVLSMTRALSLFYVAIFALEEADYILRCALSLRGPIPP